jgi:cytidyltransferase-like protein
MNTIGLIAEYNPFHLGHIYQINKIKELFPNSIIILITNATFTQRGEPTILNKWNKTQLSLENNIDLVIELPFVYATQSADIFAKGALQILNELKIDTLIFGSESNNIEKIEKIVDTQLNNQEYNNLVKKHLDKGLNYPTAMSKSLNDILGYTITEPNDLLGLSYIKEIKRNNYKIKPVSIKRTNNYHSNTIDTNIVNASLLRKMYNNNESIEKYIPKNTNNYLYKNLTNNSYFKYLTYKILTTKDLSIYQTVDEGIENRIQKAINISHNWNELINNIKTKRYTYNKINRMLIHILTNFTKEEAKNLTPDYIRILGFNSKGKQHLNKIKKELKIPIITNYKPNISKLLDIELRATSIYSLPLKNNLTELEYKHKPIIID